MAFEQFRKAASTRYDFASGVSIIARSCVSWSGSAGPFLLLGNPKSDSLLTAP